LEIQLCAPLVAIIYSWLVLHFCMAEQNPDLDVL